MKHISDIETAIQQLNPADLKEFRRWFAAFDSEKWDREFDQHASSGRLDALAEQALKDLEGGSCTEL